MSAPDSWGGPPSGPPRMLGQPARPRRGLRSPLGLVVVVGFVLIVAGLFVQLQPGLVGFGGVLFFLGLIVAAGGLWASYYLGPR